MADHIIADVFFCGCCTADAVEVWRYPVAVRGTKAMFFRSDDEIDGRAPNGNYYTDIAISGSGSLSWDATDPDNPDNYANYTSNVTVVGTLAIDEPARITLNGVVLIEPATTETWERESSSTFNSGSAWGGTTASSGSDTESATAVSGTGTANDADDFGLAINPPSASLITDATFWEDNYNPVGIITTVNTTSAAGTTATRDFTQTIPSPTNNIYDEDLSLTTTWSGEITLAIVQAEIEAARADFMLPANLEELDWYATGTGSTINGYSQPTQTLAEVDAGISLQGYDWDADIFRIEIVGGVASEITFQYRYRWVPDVGSPAAWTTTGARLQLKQVENTILGQDVLVTDIINLPGFTNDFPADFGHHEVEIIRYALIP